MDEKRKKETGFIMRQEEVAENIFSMWINTPASQIAKPGQFIDLFCHDQSRLLPRPISICEIDRLRGSIRLVYRVSGKGTKEFSNLSSGDTIQMIGPLGNGFPIGIPDE